MKSIVILMDYFGAWPKWFPVFLASCRCNDTVNWIIRTDCEIPAAVPENVRFMHVEYRTYVADISRRLRLDFNPSNNYKICDIRPAFGDMYYEEIKSYDYFGFGDLDVIYGDIRKFYTDEVLSFDVISTHPGMLSGHLALFKNVESLRKAYRKIPRWREYFENPESTRFDEDVFSSLFVRDVNPDRECILNEPAQFTTYFKEQCSTVFHPMCWHDGAADHPDVWFWKNGRVTNNRNTDREYLYLHLMNFQSMRWTNAECRKMHVPWKNNLEARFPLAGQEVDGVQIDWDGIHALNQAQSGKRQCGHPRL